jgi:hypothetical protein
MLNFIFFIFIIVIAFILFGLMFIGNVLRSIFQIGRNHSHPFGKQEEEKEENSTTQPSKKKIFDEDDGEYVDFEEIKDKGKEEEKK